MTPGAFDLPYGNPKANQSEMIEAGLMTQAASFSGTTAGLVVSALLVSPSSVNPSGQIVVHGLTVVNSASLSNAFIVRVYGGGTSTRGDKVVAIAGGNRFGPFIYNFDQPVVLDPGEELVYDVLVNFSGAKYMFVNYAINPAADNTT